MSADSAGRRVFSLEKPTLKPGFCACGAVQRNTEVRRVLGDPGYPVPWTNVRWGEHCARSYEHEVEREKASAKQLGKAQVDGRD